MNYEVKSNIADRAAATAAAARRRRQEGTVCDSRVRVVVSRVIPGYQRQVRVARLLLLLLRSSSSQSPCNLPRYCYCCCNDGLNITAMPIRRRRRRRSDFVREFRRLFRRRVSRERVDTRRRRRRTDVERRLAADDDKISYRTTTAVAAGHGQQAARRRWSSACPRCVRRAFSLRHRCGRDLVRVCVCVVCVCVCVRAHGPYERRCARYIYKIIIIIRDKTITRIINIYFAVISHDVRQPLRLVPFGRRAHPLSQTQVVKITPQVLGSARVTLSHRRRAAPGVSLSRIVFRDRRRVLRERHDVDRVFTRFVVRDGGVHVV